MSSALSDIAGDLAYYRRTAFSAWSNACSYWHDSLSARFEADYWDPLMETFGQFQAAVEQLDAEISHILSSLP